VFHAGPYFYSWLPPPTATATGSRSGEILSAANSTSSSRSEGHVRILDFAGCCSHLLARPYVSPVPIFAHDDASRSVAMHVRRRSASHVRSCSTPAHIFTLGYPHLQPQPPGLDPERSRRFRKMVCRHARPPTARRVTRRRHRQECVRTTTRSVAANRSFRIRRKVARSSCSCSKTKCTPIYPCSKKQQKLTRIRWVRITYIRDDGRATYPQQGK
jgi:hypothetical protein